jgi:hypothetical protein
VDTVGHSHIPEPPTVSLKEKLLAKRELGYRDVEVDVGTVRVRGLTRAEIVRCRDETGKTVDVELIALAMADAELTTDQAGMWLDTAPAGDYVRVLGAVSDLSGLTEGADKSGVPGD